ncbi:O-linked GlcNAc transferase, partial [Rhodopirellula maiorica SM1]
MTHPPSFPVQWRIVFTGRLASMSRVAAVRIITERGGTVRDRVSQQTDLLVIGADGWPLRKSGSMTRNLRRASELQAAGESVSIIGEAEFLRRLSGSDEAGQIRRLHTLEQLSRLLGVSGLRLRRWNALGLIQAHAPAAIAPMFDYQEVAAAKSLARLIARGVSPRKLADSLRRLQHWLPDHRGLHSSIVALEKRLLVRHGDSFVDSSGQLHFSFDEECVANFAKDSLTQESSARSTTQVDDPDFLFDRAFCAESEGRITEAMHAYTQWLGQFGD